MSDVIIPYRFVVKRDTAANFTSANTLLLQGEWALELDTGFMKIGDGSTAWNSRGYFTTDNIVEGSRLFLTPERVQDIVGGFVANSATVTWTYDDASNTISATATVTAPPYTFTNSQRVYGRNTAGSGTAEEVTLSQMLDWVGSAANGDILYRSGGSWTRLAAGTNGHVLTLASGLPSWAAPSNAVGRHMIPIMAGSMAPSVSGGCAELAKVASAANQPDIVTLDFDWTTQEYAQFSIPMPESWDRGTVTFAVLWSHAATTTNFGVAFELQAVAISDDDPIATSYGTAVAVTDTGGTTNDLYITAMSSAITVGGSPASGDSVFFRLSRATGNGSDNMNTDARVHGIRLYYTTSAATD